MNASKQVPIILLIILAVLLTACGQQPAPEPDSVQWENTADPLKMERDYEFPGDLLFVSRATGEIVALNGKTHQITPIFQFPENSTHRNAVLSKDGKPFLIYYHEGEENGKEEMFLLTYEGKVTTIEFSLPQDIPPGYSSPRWSTTKWINDEYVQGMLFDEDMIDDIVWEVRLYNPYQGDWKSLSDFSAKIKQNKFSSGFTISPDLTRALYVNDEFELVFFDLENEKELWKYSEWDGVFPNGETSTLAGAIWSNDGEHLAVEITTKCDNSANEYTPAILVMSKDGKIENSIMFGNYQHGLEWSADDSRLWFYEDRCTTDPTASDCDTRIVIRSIDMKNGLLSDNFELNLDKPPQGNIDISRWNISPDGRFQVLSLYNSRNIDALEPNRDEIILFNISDPQLWQMSIDHNSDLFGWSGVHWESP